MYPERVRRYSLSALGGAPEVLTALLADLTGAEADHRPDPERFTIREVIAHLADWEPIWEERLRGIAEKDHPELPGYDEGQFAMDHDYAHSDPMEQLARFREGRANLVEFLGQLSPEAWERTGHHLEIGVITLGQLVTLMLGHDGHHLKQIVEWRKSAS